jgi:hypothetical protein
MESLTAAVDSGIWYTGGGVIWARFYSRFLALQIKANVEGAALKLHIATGVRSS